MCVYVIGSKTDDGVVIILAVVIPLFIIAVIIAPVLKAVKRQYNKQNQHKQSTIPLELDYKVPGI